MWALIAVITFALNGAPVHEIATFSLKFPTEQACQDFRASPSHTQAIAELRASEAEEHGVNVDGVTIVTDCKVDEART